MAKNNFFLRQYWKRHHIAIVSVALTAICALYGFLAYHFPLNSTNDTKSADPQKHKKQQIEISEEQKPVTTKSRSDELQLERHTKEAKSSIRDTTMRETLNLDETTKSLNVFYTKFNLAVNSNNNDSNKIDIIFAEYFYSKDTSTSATYEKFKQFMMNLVDREVAFNFVNIRKVNAVPENNYNKIVVEGIYILNEQYSKKPVPFVQTIIIENGNKLKFYGWL